MQASLPDFLTIETPRNRARRYELLAEAKHSLRMLAAGAFTKKDRDLNRRRWMTFVAWRVDGCHARRLTLLERLALAWRGGR